MEDRLLAITWCKALSARDVRRRPSALGRNKRFAIAAAGTALLATIVTKRERFHSNIIGQAVDLGREEVRTRIAQMTNYFLAHGVTDPAAAHQQAVIALGNAVKQQALVMGFSDTFAVVGVVLIIARIAILLTGKPKGGAAAGGGH